MDSESNVAGTSGIFRWTRVVSSVVYPQDTVWLPSPNQINSEIIQPFPLQICKLSYMSSSNWQRKPETDTPRPDSHLHHDLRYVLCSVRNCRSSENLPLSHKCNAVSSLPWTTASFSVQRVAEVQPQLSWEWSCSFTGTVSKMGVTCQRLWCCSVQVQWPVWEIRTEPSRLATAGQPETIILKFSKSVKSVVYEGKTGSLPLSAQDFKKSSSSEDLYSMQLFGPVKAHFYFTLFAWPKAHL